MAVNSLGIHAFTVLTSAELAERLKVKESWVVEASKPYRTNDPLPSISFGKYRRFLWDSPELVAWMDRRAGRTTRKVGHD
jgi:hypothetical protein